MKQLRHLANVLGKVRNIYRRDSVASGPKEVGEVKIDMEQIKEEWLVSNAVVAFVGALLMAQGLGAIGQRQRTTHLERDSPNPSTGRDPRHDRISGELIVHPRPRLRDTTASVLGHSSSLSLLAVPGVVDVGGVSLEPAICAL